MQSRVSLGDLSGVLAIEVRRRIADGGLSGAELARRTVLTQPFVSNWLAGRRGLSLDACECVMVALRLDISEVLAGSLGGVVAPKRRLFLVPRRPSPGSRSPAAVAGVRVAA